MTDKPPFQRHLQFLVAVGIVVFAAAAAVVAVLDFSKRCPPFVSYAGIALLAAVWIGLVAFLRRRGLSWIASGQMARLTGLAFKGNAFFAGLIVLLAIPRLVELFRSTEPPPMTTVAVSSTPTAVLTTKAIDTPKPIGTPTTRDARLASPRRRRPTIYATPVAGPEIRRPTEPRPPTPAGPIDWRQILMAGNTVALRVHSLPSNLSTSQLIAGQVYQIRFDQSHCEWWSKGLIDHMIDKQFVVVVSRASPTLKGYFGSGATEMTTNTGACRSPLDKNVVVLNMTLSFDANGQLSERGQVWARLEEVTP